MKRIKLLNDQPLGLSDDDRKDGLGFRTYSQVISDTVRGTSGPFTIGVFGEWGTGKTSLLQLIKKNLSEDSDCVTVWFNAWMYEREEHPLLPLLATIVKTLSEENSFWSNISDQKENFINALRSVAYGFASKAKLKIPGFAEIEASFIAKDMIDRESMLKSDPLLDKSLYYNAFYKLSTVKISQSKKIVVIIDDLDRCFPDKAIKLLESIKLVLAERGFIFIIGVSRKIIEGYLRHRYREKFGIAEFEGQKYLDKIVQLAFPIPPHTQRIKKFYKTLIKQIGLDDQKALMPVLPIVGAACAYNPRATVRFINNLLIDMAISTAIGLEKKIKETPIGYFAMTRCLQYRWEDVYQTFLSSDEICQQFAEIDEKQMEALSEEPKESIASNLAKVVLDEPDLIKLIMSGEGKDWLKNKENRHFAIDFLSTQRQQSEESEFVLKPNYETLPTGTSRSRIRVYELARELNVTNKVAMDKLAELGIAVISHMSPVNSEDVRKLKEHLMRTERDQIISRIKPTVIRRRKVVSSDSEDFISHNSQADISPNTDKKNDISVPPGIEDDIDIKS
jgi:hypothetical protein